MFNRRSGLLAAIIAGALFAATAPAVAQYGYGVGVGASVGVGAGYGYGGGYAQPYGYAQPGYGYAQPGYGYAQPSYGYQYAQPGHGYQYGQQSYGAPVYTAHTTYYAQPSYGYAQPGYGAGQAPCCSWWDRLWGNCCAQPSYQPVAAAVPSYAPSAYAAHGQGGVHIVNNGSMYVGHGAAPVARPHHSHAHYAPYVAPGPRYVRPRVRRHVVYRPVYQRPHVIYRTRVVTRTRVIAAPRRHPAMRFDVSAPPAVAAPQRKVLEPQR
jgi:hypothetical protein